MAQRAIQTATTNKLLELNKRKERKANRAKGNWGNARVINKEVIDQRKKDAAITYNKKMVQQALKELNKEERRLRALGPNIFALPRPPATSRRRTPATQISPPAPASLLRPVSPPPCLSSAETPPSYPTTRCFSSAKTSKNGSKVASQGDYAGPTAGPAGGSAPPGELRGASGSTNGKRTTCKKAS